MFQSGRCCGLLSDPRVFSKHAQLAKIGPISFKDHLNIFHTVYSIREVEKTRHFCGNWSVRRFSVDLDLTLLTGQGLFSGLTLIPNIQLLLAFT